ncbi:MAG: dTMP kinase [Akkermansiaceae bacterium]
MTSEFLKAVSGHTALLRGGESSRGLAAGDDWDFFVSDTDEARSIASDYFGQPLLEKRNRYVEQRFYDWGGLDFLPGFEWNGWRYLDETQFWGKTFLDQDGVRKPCLAHDAFIAWFCGLLHGGNYKKRYDELIFLAVQKEREEFRECLVWAFGKDWATDLERMAMEKRPKDALEVAADLRGAVKWQNLCREGLFALGPVVAHWWTELKNHWEPPFPWITFLGPDGSGKSTVIDGLRTELAKCRIKLKHVHWRPTVRKPIPDEPGPPMTDPHGRPRRNVLLSVGALGLLLIRWWIGYPLRLLHARAKSHVILSDRYYLDLLVDQQRYLYGGPDWLARFFLRFLPRPDFTAVLLTDADTILARKAEVEKPELERQLVAYRELAESLGDRAVVVDVAQSAEEVVAEVTGVVKERFRERTALREGGGR